MKTTVMIDGRRVKIADFEAMEKITVTGNLDLYDTNVKRLPDNLSVGGYLDLQGTGITALPDNLSVGGSLDLRGTGITALPDNLSVGGSLYLDLYDVSFPVPGKMKIGCQHHSISDWESFTDSQINAMDGVTARKFWATWRGPLLTYVKDVNARKTSDTEAA